MEWSFITLNKISRVNAKDVSYEKLIAAVAEFLKKSGKFKVPEWIDVIKSGPNRYLAPTEPSEWLFIRAASNLRKLYLAHKGMGVGSFQTHYGGKYERGCQHNLTRASSAKVIRYCIKQLEDMKLVETLNVTLKDSDKKYTEGRRVTKKGVQELNNIAKELGKKSA